MSHTKPVGTRQKLQSLYELLTFLPRTYYHSVNDVLILVGVNDVLKPDK
jgi:hypothetical protein